MTFRELRKVIDIEQVAFVEFKDDNKYSDKDKIENGYYDDCIITKVCSIVRVNEEEHFIEGKLRVWLDYPKKEV